jgi:hypothetical protein
MKSSSIVLVVLGIVLFSCSESGNADELKTKELELKERELELREKELEETEAKDEVKNEAKLDFQWDSYYNQRYDFSVAYPSNFLKEKGESDARDGNTFTNANGSSEMRASGTYNALDQTIKEQFQSATENNRYYDDERIVTYKVQKGNWFVVSGTYNESIFYVKTILKNDTFYTLYFEYHPSEKKQFDEIIQRVTKDFP